MFSQEFAPPAPVPEEPEVDPEVLPLELEPEAPPAPEPELVVAGVPDELLAPGVPVEVLPAPEPEPVGPVVVVELEPHANRRPGAATRARIWRAEDVFMAKIPFDTLRRRKGGVPVWPPLREPGPDVRFCAPGRYAPPCVRDAQARRRAVGSLGCSRGDAARRGRGEGPAG